MPSRSSIPRVSRADAVAECRRLRARVRQLESLCGELYQVVGTAGAPVQVLDKVWAAASGKPIPRVRLLPIAESDFEVSRG